MKQFIIKNNYLTVNHLRLLEPVLRSNMPDEVIFKGHNIGDEGIKIITTVMNGEHLNALCFGNNGMMEIGAECVGKLLQYCPVLCNRKHWLNAYY